MRYKIPLPLFVLFIGTLLVTAASFTGIGPNTANFVLKNNGTATNLSVIGRLMSSTSATNTTTTVLGYSLASGQDAIAIGQNADVVGTQSAAIGASSYARGNYSLAIGTAAQATLESSLAIGAQAASTNSFSVAIGNNARTTAANQLRLGRSTETVSIPGALVTEGLLTVTNANPSVLIAGSGGAATLQYYTEAGASGAKRWDAVAFPGKFALRSVKDDYSSAFEWLSVERDNPNSNSPNVVRMTLGTNTTVKGSLAVEGPVTQARNTLTYTGGTNVLVDCSLGNDFTLTVTAPVYLLFTNVPAVTRSWTANVQFKQNATGGFATTLAATNCTGTNLTFSVVANAVTLLSVVNSAYTNGQVIGNALISQ